MKKTAGLAAAISAAVLITPTQTLAQDAGAPQLSEAATAEIVTQAANDFNAASSADIIVQLIFLLMLALALSSSGGNGMSYGYLTPT